MPSASVKEFAGAAAVRSCCRCGGEFQKRARELLCQDCRKSRRPDHLSFREKQIVGLVAQGKPNKEIAYVLHLAEGTVKEYMVRIMKKLGAANRTDVAIRVLSSGTVPLPAPLGETTGDSIAG